MLSTLLALIGCGPLTADTAADRLERTLVRAVERKSELRHGILHVDAPARGLTGTWAAGDVHADTPFHAASVGKLFTAMTVLRLADEGVLSLDDPLSDWLDGAVWSGLPVVGGDDALASVTLAQLLGHRSGLPDYFESEIPTVDGAPSVSQLLVDEPDRTWSPHQLLDYTRAHFAAAGAPGETFAYADTNYDLVGLVVEAATGRAFHEAVREQVIDPLGLTHTWYYNHEAAPPGLDPIAGVWMEDVNLAGQPCLTADWAGGGIATTAGDLARFVRALVTNELVAFADLQQPRTDDALERGIDYGLGLWRIRPGRLFFALGGLPELQGASGSSGSFAYWLEEHDAVIVGHVRPAHVARGAHSLPAVQRGAHGGAARGGARRQPVRGTGITLTPGGGGGSSGTKKSGNSG